MQKKRNIQLLISLAVFVAATLITFYLLHADREAVVDKNIFRLEDFTKIDQVVLTKEGKTITLNFDGVRWKVNDRLADRSMIDVLFATLQQVEPRRPVGESIRDSIKTILDKQGVKVSLFQGGELRKEFLAGGNSTKTQAYFNYPDEEESYVMVIPGYRVYASGIFELEENGWKDKYVFNFNWKNFQRLKSSFPAHPDHDFEVAMGDDYFEIKGLAAIDTTKLNDFLDAVSLLSVDEYMDTDKDTLTSSQPYQEILVSDVSGKTYSLSLYETANPSEVLAIIGGTQRARLSRQKVAGLFRNKKWFIKK